MVKLISLIAAAALIVGCASHTVGQRFDGAAVAQLRTGVSTAQQARSLLGEPWQVQTNDKGEQLLIWQHIHASATPGLVSTNVTTNTQQAALVFSPQGTLLRAHKLVNVPPPQAQ